MWYLVIRPYMSVVKILAALLKFAFQMPTKRYMRISFGNSY